MALESKPLFHPEVTRDDGQPLALTPEELHELAFAGYAEEKLGKKGTIARIVEFFRRVDKFVSNHPGNSSENPTFTKFIEETRPYTEQEWRELTREVCCRIVSDQATAGEHSSLLAADESYIRTLTPMQQYVLIVSAYAEERMGKEGVIAATLDFFRKVDRYNEKHPRMTAEDPAFERFLGLHEPDWTRLEWCKVECAMVANAAARPNPETTKVVAPPRTPAHGGSLSGTRVPLQPKGDTRIAPADPPSEGLQIEKTDRDGRSAERTKQAQESQCPLQAKARQREGRFAEIEGSQSGTQPASELPAARNGKRKVLTVGAVVLGVILFVATEGGIVIVAVGIFAFLMLGLMLLAFGHGVAEHFVGDNPSWKAVAVGVLIILFGLVVCGRSCRFQGNDDPSDVPGWMRP